MGRKRTEQAKAVKKKRHLGLAVTLSIVCLALVFAFATFLQITSAISNLKEQALAVERDVARVENALRDLDAEAFMSSAASLGATLADLSDNLDGWQWGIAAAVGAYGDDLTGARELVSVGRELVDDALLPLADAVSSSWGTFAQGGLGALLEDVSLDEALSLIDGIENAVRDAETRLASLPAFSIEELAAAAESLGGIVDEVGEAFDAYDELAEGVESAKGLAEDVLSGDTNKAVSGLANILGLTDESSR